MEVSATDEGIHVLHLTGVLTTSTKSMSIYLHTNKSSPPASAWIWARTTASLVPPIIRDTLTSVEPTRIIHDGAGYWNLARQSSRSQKSNRHLEGSSQGSQLNLMSQAMSRLKLTQPHCLYSHATKSALSGTAFRSILLQRYIQRPVPDPHTWPRTRNFDLALHVVTSSQSFVPRLLGMQLITDPKGRIPRRCACSGTTHKP